MPSGVSADLELKVYEGGVWIDTKTVNPAFTKSLTFKYTGSSGKKELQYVLGDQEILAVELDFEKGTCTTVRQGMYTSKPRPRSVS